MLSKEEAHIIEVVLKTIELQRVVNNNSDVETLKEIVNSQQVIINAWGQEVDKLKVKVDTWIDDILNKDVKESTVSKRGAGQLGKKRGPYKKKQKKHVLTNTRFAGFKTNAQYLAKIEKMLNRSKLYTADQIEKEIFKKHPTVLGFSGKDMIREIKQARWRLWYHMNKKKQPPRDPALNTPFSADDIVTDTPF
jgi:hypothetical protein